MLKPKITKINFTYKNTESKLSVINIDDIPVDKSQVKSRQIVYFEPNGCGGNHKHPRVEWFVAFGELVFIWLDENGDNKEFRMNPDGEIYLIEVPPFLPHAVKNMSSEKIGLMYELADGKQINVERIKVV